MKVTKQEKIHAAHMLDLSYESKCCRLHGHEYVFELQVSGMTNKHGMVLDYADISATFDLVLDAWDHRFLCPLRYSTVQDDKVRVEYPHRTLDLPRDDVALLQVSESTAENIAKEFLLNCATHIPDAANYRFAALVKETHTTSVRFPEIGFADGERLLEFSEDYEEL